MQEQKKSLKETIVEHKDELIAGALVLVMLKQRRTSRDLRNLARAAKNAADAGQDVISVLETMRSDINDLYAKNWRTAETLRDHATAINSQSETVTKLTHRLGLFDSIFGARAS